MKLHGGTIAIPWLEEIGGNSLQLNHRIVEFGKINKISCSSSLIGKFLYFVTKEINEYLILRS
ncbi:hypothetical protein, partial [Escherichia coli]|uniref:hypothetical protein n=1 Tax=Escherichia coli TaxID=562 RepID=UPI0032DB052E